jgi:hypothetical protein
MLLGDVAHFTERSVCCVLCILHSTQHTYNDVVLKSVLI